MLCGGWSGAFTLHPVSGREEFRAPPKTIPRSVGRHTEWVKACKEGKPEDDQTGLVYSGPFAESLVVGTLVLRLKDCIE
ncbi:MAG: hypothetical protein KA354_15975 [Phycisphaerae bacterium]|nr:hypothetical protein [Phycisphaerae bacterium]